MIERVTFDWPHVPGGTPDVCSGTSLSQLKKNSSN